MKKKYKITYTWHSGESFGATMKNETIVEIEENELESYKRKFQEDNMDGSYCSINRIEEIN